jgi:hypothetical protein
MVTKERLMKIAPNFLDCILPIEGKCLHTFLVGNARVSACCPISLFIDTISPPLDAKNWQTSPVFIF